MLTSNLLKEFLQVIEQLKSKKDFDNLSKQEQEYIKILCTKMENSILETEDKLGITSEEELI